MPLRSCLVLLSISGACAQPVAIPWAASKPLPLQEVSSLAPAGDGSLWLLGRDKPDQPAGLWHLTLAGLEAARPNLGELIALSGSPDGDDLWAIARSSEGPKALWQLSASGAWEQIRVLPDCYRQAEWALTTRGHQRVTVLCVSTGSEEPNAGFMLTLEGREQKDVRVTSSQFRLLLTDPEGELLAVDVKGDVLRIGEGGTSLHVPAGAEPSLGPQFDLASVKLEPYDIPAHPGILAASSGGTWIVAGSTSEIAFVSWSGGTRQLALTPQEFIVARGVGRAGALLLATVPEQPSGKTIPAAHVSGLRLGPQALLERWSILFPPWVELASLDGQLREAGGTQWALFPQVRAGRRSLGWTLLRRDASGWVRYVSPAGEKEEPALLTRWQQGEEAMRRSRQLGQALWIVAALGAVGFGAWMWRSRRARH